MTTKAEKSHMAWVRNEHTCLVCGGAATGHHVTGYADRLGRFSRSERLIVPLCPMHHQAVHDPFVSAPVSVERLGHRGFFWEHGIDLLAEARRLEAESVSAGILPELRAAA